MEYLEIKDMEIDKLRNENENLKMSLYHQQHKHQNLPSYSPSSRNSLYSPS